jgi:hypothetical protein
VLSTIQYLREGKSGIELDVHFIVLEGENADELTKAKIPSKRIKFLPENIDAYWKHDFSYGKQWVRTHLGDAALATYNFAEIVPLLHHPEFADKLAKHIRPEVDESKVATYQEASSTISRNDLYQFSFIGKSEKVALDTLFLELENSPSLGTVNYTEEHSLLRGIRPSEYLRHLHPGLELVPYEWSSVDWILVNVGNRNAEDLLDRCLLRSLSDDGQIALNDVVGKCKKSIVSLIWPAAQADSGLSADPWDSLSIERMRRKMIRSADSTAQSSPFEGSFLHFNEPEESNSSGERIAQIADFLELLAIAQVSAPDLLSTLCERQGNSVRGIVLGIARMIAEAKNDKIGYIASMEAGTRWSVKPDSVQAEMGAWSIEPSRWTQNPSDILTSTLWIMGDPFKKAIDKGTALSLIYDRNASDKLGEIRGTETAPIASSFENFLAAFVILSASNPVWSINS